MKLFCAQCGKPTEYTLSLPKFCSGCGQSFSATASSRPTVSTPVAPKPQFKLRGEQSPPYREDDYEESNPDATPDSELTINPRDYHKIKPKFKIINMEAGPESFGSVLSQSYASKFVPEPNQPRQQAHAPVSDVMAEFQKEAGAIRK